MDSSVSQLDLEQLNEKDKAELRQFVGNENQRTRVRERTQHPLFSAFFIQILIRLANIPARPQRHTS